MTIFWPSTHPSSRSLCRNASRQGCQSEGDVTSRKPIRGTFPACCASAMTAKASITTAIRIDVTAALFIAHLVSSVMYHADRDKGKCDLHDGRRQEWEGQNQPETELNGASARLVGSSRRRIIAAWFSAIT